jgi:hypothetical protein
MAIALATSPQDGLAVHIFLAVSNVYRPQYPFEAKIILALILKGYARDFGLCRHDAQVGTVSHG